ncbi:AbrB family transcriptional regulator [Rubrivivax sp. RP6-9]|uniref:AbrB family transcriptional regulator n=1 Tax=Rubrivivax sp. RP6-9 TaxID=3415750 RepID=UPI003CC5D9F5
MWPPPSAGPVLRLAGTLGLATAAALAARALHVPLPWMLGPLLVTALCGVAGLPLQASNRLRNVGQWVIGIALGLYFTPAVLVLIGRLAPAIALGVAWALLLGHLFQRFLRRSNGVDRATACFAAAIGGASEMAVLAERHGGRVDRVAAAHSLRVLLVVLIVPLGLQFSGVQGLDPTPPAGGAVHVGGLALLLAVTAAGIAVLHRLQAPNPFVLGALAVTVALTAAGIALSALPAWASPAAQLFIGIALGTRFTPAFVQAAPRWLGSVAAGTLVMLAASALAGWGLAHVVGLHPATAVLATAPGGIAEMAITAKVLQLGVPVVTAFQVVRYVAVLTLTPLLYRRGAG